MYVMLKEIPSVSGAKASSTDKKQMLDFPDDNVGFSAQIFSHKRLEECKYPYHETYAA